MILLRSTLLHRYGQLIPRRCVRSESRFRSPGCVLRTQSLTSTSGEVLPEKKDENVPEPPPSNATQALIDVSTKGVGQVLFLNSKTSGQILLASLAIGDPYLAVWATLGTLTSTATAQSLSLSSKGMLENGLYSYNGCLVGCATSVFLASTQMSTSSLVFATAAGTVTGAAAATVVTAILSKHVCPPMPQWTLAFNIVTLTALLRIQPLATSSTATDAVAPTTAFSDVLLSPLTGLSQIFVVESAVTGAGVLAAIASYSPALAAHTLMGSTIGSLMGALVYQAPLSNVAAGLWGYNAALTSLGVGVFFIPSWQTTALSVTGAMATSAVFGAMLPTFTATPCLTLPFCITMSACWMLGTPSVQRSVLVPGLILSANPHSPETNAL
jgi:urea transporter